MSTRTAAQVAEDVLSQCLRRMSRGTALRRALMNESNAETQVPYGQPLVDAVSLFEELGIGYALAGGVAAMYYGRARFTEDFDFVAATGHTDVFASNPEAMKRHHFDPGCSWKLYHASGIDVDIWKDEFCDEIVSRAVVATLVGRAVRVAEMHDLVAMKLRGGRIQDDYDISEILRRQRIDESIVRSRVTAEQFQRLLDIKRRV